MSAANVFDPLWVPVLTHYGAEPEPRLDLERTKDHLHQLTSDVTQYLIAGTTGAGWKMTDAVLEDWLELAAAPDVLTPDHKILFGAFGNTTEDVIARARFIEKHLSERPAAATFAGITVCAPVDENADQRDIVRHFREIIEATSSPLAVYQLPQITRCEIAPETFAELSNACPRITLFKDTSGNDRVAASGLNFGDVKMLRGAEGGYFEQLKPAGPYDGWLLSTANGFAPQIRRIANLAAAGKREEGKAESDELTSLVTALFDIAQTVEIGNPFSNANRAVDHFNAYGDDWAGAPLPRLTSGETLPKVFLVEVERLLSARGLRASVGYRTKSTD